MTPDDVEKWAIHVSVEPDGCWLWTGVFSRGGYGRMRTSEGRDYAHRIGYRLVRGPIPPGLELDHLCRVTACVNPDHLEAVTHQVNLQRGDSFQRAKVACPQGHPYDEANTRVYRGMRYCRTCGHARDKARWSHAA